MQVNKVDYSNSFKANEGKFVQKIIKGSLNDDSTAVIRMTLNDGKDIISLEGYTFKKGECISGKGMGKNSGLPKNEIFSFFEDVQNKAKDGVNFFKDFTKAMLS